MPLKNTPNLESPTRESCHNILPYSFGGYSDFYMRFHSNTLFITLAFSVLFNSLSAVEQSWNEVETRIRNLSGLSLTIGVPENWKAISKEELAATNSALKAKAPELDLPIIAGFNIIDGSFQDHGYMTSVLFQRLPRISTPEELVAYWGETPKPIPSDNAIVVKRQGFDIKLGKVYYHSKLKVIIRSQLTRNSQGQRKVNIGIFRPGKPYLIGIHVSCVPELYEQTLAQVRKVLDGMKQDRQDYFDTVWWVKFEEQLRQKAIEETLQKPQTSAPGTVETLPIEGEKKKK